MAFRFHRRIKILPGVRINISKSGLSASLGRRGASLTLGKKGPQAHLGIPGTGLSYSTRLRAGARTPVRPRPAPARPSRGPIIAAVVITFLATLLLTALLR